MFGFGERKMDLQINKFNFVKGETIEGTIALTVKKPCKARGVFVTLFAEQKVMSSSNTQRIYELKQQLDGEKEYNTGENPAVYPFKIKIPPKQMTGEGLAQLDPNLAKAASVMQYFVSMQRQIRWYVEAKLDIAFGLDTAKKIQVNINDQ